MSKTKKKDLMSIDIAKLRALAKKATPGPWEVVDGLQLLDCTPARVGPCDVYPPKGDETGQQGRDAEYIAAVSPEHVLAILEQLESAWNAVVVAKSALSFYAGGTFPVRGVRARQALAKLPSVKTRARRIG